MYGLLYIDVHVYIWVQWDPAMFIPFVPLAASSNTSQKLFIPQAYETFYIQVEIKKATIGTVR